MGRKPKDLDIATDAKPDAVEKLFPKTVSVGKQFGVIRVVGEVGAAGDIEVATFRSDGAYHDGRRPETVHFAGPEQDALRRDFTCNALFFDLQSGMVHDFVDGIGDIKRRVIKAVGDPESRFDEDRLRMLRAVRFVSQLNFEIEEATWQAICKKSGKIFIVSRERIRDEFLRLLAGGSRSTALQLLVTSRLDRVLPSPLQAQLHSSDVLARVSHFSSEEMDPKVILPVLCLELSEPDIEQTCDELRLSRAFGDHLIQSVRMTKLMTQEEPLEESQVWRMVSGNRWLSLLPAWQALVGAGALESSRLAELQNDPRVGQPLPEALVTAAWLSQKGVPSGPLMGELLKEAFQLQLAGKLKNLADAEIWITDRLKD